MKKKKKEKYREQHPSQRKQNEIENTKRIKRAQQRSSKTHHKT